MQNRWVLVADSTYARIFEAREGELKLVQELEHLQSREQNHDLIGNRPNQNQHGMEKDLKGNDPQHLRDGESAFFAKQLRKVLATAHSQNRFRELVLVADPKFLGLLRKELEGGGLGASVIGSIDKRGVGMRPDQVAEMIGGV